MARRGVPGADPGGAGPGRVGGASRSNAAASPCGEVSVGGVVVPEVNPLPPMVRYWSFDVASNTITFEPFAQPAAGAAVSIRYVTACIP